MTSTRVTGARLEVDRRARRGEAGDGVGHGPGFDRGRLAGGVRRETQIAAAEHAELAHDAPAEQKLVRSRARELGGACRGVDEREVVAAVAPARRRDVVGEAGPREPITFRVGRVMPGGEPLPAARQLVPRVIIRARGREAPFEESTLHAARVRRHECIDHEVGETRLDGGAESNAVAVDVAVHDRATVLRDEERRRLRVRQTVGAQDSGDDRAVLLQIGRDPFRVLSPHAPPTGEVER